MTELIEQKSEALAHICRRFQVARLELFGSACTPEFDPNRSDLDFLVDFLPGANLGPWLSRLFELQAALEALFGRKVDLIMASALKNPWFRREAGKPAGLCSMHPKSPKWLQDILEACELIQTAARGSSLAQYEQDRLLRSAIERNFEIIGEALNRIDRIDPETASRIPEHASIIAFRNVLIHGYDYVDHSRVWQSYRSRCATPAHTSGSIA